MKVSKLRKFWIILVSVFWTADICTRAVFKGLFSKPDRKWVDATIQVWVDRLLKCIDAKCVVFNPHKVKPIPGQATFVMVNHTSIYDIPLGFKIFPENSIRMLAKKELSKIPMMCQGMINTEFPFIERKNRVQAFKDLAYARQLMESGIVIWVAPEGTRSMDGKLKPFKKGAFITAIEAKAMIIPVYIKGAYEMLPSKTYDISLGETAEIHIGEAIDASQYTIENKDELVKKTHDAMSALM